MFGAELMRFDRKLGVFIAKRVNAGCDVDEYSCLQIYVNLVLLLSSLRCSPQQGQAGKKE